MSLTRRNKSRPDHSQADLIKLREAAAILGLDPSTIRKREAGTERLCHVRQGRPGSKRQRIFLLRVEVLAHHRQLIEDARAQQERSEIPLKYLLGDRPTLTREEIKEMVRPYKIKEGSEK